MKRFASTYLLICSVLTILSISVSHSEYLNGSGIHVPIDQSPVLSDGWLYELNHEPLPVVLANR